MFKNPILNLFSYSWKYSFGIKRYLVLVIILTVIANLIQLAEPIIVGRIFNSIQFFEDGSQLLRSTIQNFAILFFITLGFWIFHGTSRIIERKGAFLIRKNYKKEMFDKVLNLPAAWHKDHHSGDTIDKINKSSEALYDFSDSKFRIIEGVTRLLGSVVVLVYFDWKSSVIAVLVTMIVVVAISFFDRKLSRGYKKVFKWENFLASAIHDYITNVFTIITLRLKKRVSREIESRSMKAYPQYMKNTKLNESKWFSTGMAISLMTVIILILNAYSSYKMTGTIVIGTLFILYRYLEEVGGTFYNFAWTYGEMIRRNSAVTSAEVINEEYEKIALKKTDKLPKEWKNISIRDLNFSYSFLEKIDKANRGKIENISLNIKKGEKIALIGESGSGKSTLLYLLRGLYEAQKVDVFCDGKEKKNGLSIFRDETTLIPQEPEIFNSTIEDNITMSTKASKNELMEAIKISQFESVLARLPRGLKTDISEKGVNLSGGEKQRLALARGILAGKDSTFLFLDEPTSSVDSINEISIYKNISSKFSEKTIISSVHKVHLLEFFDYIYYFDKGKIIAEGTLGKMFENEKFRQLWDSYKKTKRSEN